MTNQPANPTDYAEARRLADQVGAPDSLYDALFDIDDPLGAVRQWAKENQ